MMNFFAKLENQNNENYDYVNKFIIHPKKKDNFNISQTIKLFLDKINDTKIKLIKNNFTNQ